MDDFEDNRVRRARGLRPHDPNASEKIPPEQRGRVTCPFCEGKGGRYMKVPHKPNTNIYIGCATCKLHGELDPVKLEEEYRASIAGR